MKPSYKKALKALLFLSCGVFVLYWVYREQDPTKLLDGIKNDVNYWWIILSMLIGFVSHLSRTIRWQMLIKPIEKKPNLTNTFLAVIIGYFANLLLPRMGEISRCGALSKYEEISFSKLVGTVVIERLIDFIMLIIAFILVLILQFNIVSDFLATKADFTGIINLITNPITYMLFFLIAAGLYIFRRTISQIKIFKNLKGIWGKFSEGFLAIKKIDNKWLFLFHTVFIWVLYYLMILVAFYAFESTTHLSSIVGLTVFVMGSLGMVAPVQGGVGPWHFMVIASLSLYGIGNDDSALFALVVHSSINASLIIMGLIALGLLPIINRNKIKHYK